LNHKISCTFISFVVLSQVGPMSLLQHFPSIMLPVLSNFVHTCDVNVMRDYQSISLLPTQMFLINHKSILQQVITWNRLHNTQSEQKTLFFFGHYSSGTVNETIFYSVLQFVSYSIQSQNINKAYKTRADIKLSNQVLKKQSDTSLLSQLVSI